MNLLCWTALLLGLLLRGHASGYHTLRYVYTGVSQPSPGLPQFISVGYVDGQRFIHYDSEERKVKSGVPWMEKVDQEDPHYWERQMQSMQGSESSFRRNLAVLRNRYNQSGGFHTFQVMYGCDLNEDVPSGGFRQEGYDGRDLIAFDKETLTWTATDAAALITKRKWEAEPALAQHLKAYLEEECVEWLRKYLRYGKETLLRKEPPTVKVTRKDSQEGLETLLCQAHGFYPKEIDITWRKDGEVKQEDTFCGVVSPNVDGTYYTWLSIKVDPTVRRRYQCHVEHDGLQEPLDVTMEESVPVWVIALGVSVSLLLVLMVVTGLILYRNSEPETGTCLLIVCPAPQSIGIHHSGKTMRNIYGKPAKPQHQGKPMKPHHQQVTGSHSALLTELNSSTDRLIPSQCEKYVEGTHQSR